MEQTTWFIIICWMILGVVAMFLRSFGLWLNVTILLFLFILLPAAVIKVLVS